MENEKEKNVDETETAEKNESKAEGKEPEAKDMGFDDFLKNPKMQAEFDRRLAKALKTHDEKAKAKEPEAQANEAAKTTAENDEIEQLKAQIAGYKLNAKIEDMAGEYGLTHAQVPYIARLVNAGEATGDGGEIDGDKLKAQIDAIAKAFPNLISKAKDEKEETAPFKFGGDGGDGLSKNEALNAEISNIFGVGDGKKHFF
jgi:hypothetical protein